MDIDRYERKYVRLYAAFGDAVAEILNDAVALDGKYHLQQITRRAKDPASLRQKLKNRKLLRSGEIESHIKDLAGCRLVFYTNGDVDRFLHSGIIRDNFVVEWERTKFHHSPDATDDADVMFRGTNYVVRLNEARQGLPEYSRFGNMVCEIQVQTTLNHAWSEMAHDTIYKHPTLKGFGGRLMSGIRTRMAAIMRDHLIPAGYEFQKVAVDFARLASGKPT
jgi:ppGpp synthetase/RelA/SpoT-type nucleotidyltranferase